jgi:hypothetical protein
MRALLVLGLVLIVAAFSADPPREATARTAAADTLRYELTAGQSLVVPLPGRDDASFRGVRLPALSLLVDRSFAWRTLPGETGREYILIQRRTAARTDTLVLVVDVE